MKKILNLIFQIYISFFMYIPTGIGVLLRYIVYKPLFKSTDGFFKIDFGVTILGFENIIIKKNVSIMKNSYIYANDGGFIEIGNNFSMNTNSQLDASNGKIVIKDDCAIGPNCVLRASNHVFKNVNIPFRLQGHDYGEIIVENDVWIASNCVITPNTRIGRSSVLAAGCVATKDIEPYSVVGGVPAKLIRKRKEWTV